METEGRKSYRRGGRGRRVQERRELAERRAKAERRRKEDMQGASARAKAAAAAAPKSRVAEPAPREPSRITLNDIVLRSLAGVDPAFFAAELVNRKVFPSEKAARQALVTTPTVLARYVGHETSQAVCSSLKGDRCGCRFERLPRKLPPLRIFRALRGRGQ